jgi:cobalt-zinc-cadmium efflux system protein
VAGEPHAHGLAHAHAHAHGGATDSFALRAAFAVTAGTLVLEAVGGWLTGSVALLADAGHMLTDAGALAVALFAAQLASRPRTAHMTFGYGRVEILAALGNGFLLGGVSVGIAVEAIERLRDPGPVAVGPMIAIACVGLVANLVSAQFLRGSERANLNVRAAYLHVLGDALGSIAAIGAGLTMALGGLRAADGIAALAIAALLVASAVRLMRDAVDVLLERSPRHLDPEQIAREVRAIPGVVSIHDLHVWTVSSGFLAMSGHVDLASGADAEQVRKAVHRLLHQTYDIRHTTIQTEHAPGLLSIEPSPDASSNPPGAECL